jgi:hypothetical protein
MLDGPRIDTKILDGPRIPGMPRIELRQQVIRGPGSRPRIEEKVRATGLTSQSTLDDRIGANTSLDVRVVDPRESAARVS